VKNSLANGLNQFRFLDPNFPDRLGRGVCALAVMTKVPQPGRVKTRLVPPLTPKEAAELNKCFLRDTAAAISSACIRRPAYPPKPRRTGMGDARKMHFKPPACGIAVYTPVGAESAYTDILPADFSLLPQRGEKFGQRLYFAVEDLFKCGFDSVCLIDSDSPTVPAEDFAEAVELLSTSEDRVVLGPSDDGGYYLIGLKKPHRDLFEQIDWSTERVLNQTIQRATEIGLEVKLLPAGYDVDDDASLRRLYSELLGEQGDDSVAPNTRRFLAGLVRLKKL
jgi:rSAM/selenodomain-associated transferase 1